MMITMEYQAMIELTNVTRDYGGVHAVDDVSFTIRENEIVGLLGHNGAGKTTIMKMMTGGLEPTSGAITVKGKDIVKHRREIQGYIGYLPENCPVYPEMTVVDYLDYTATLHGLAEKGRHRLLGDALHRTGLMEKADQPIATLSRGYRQRTGVAQAILHRPAILILDEPTNGLDPTQISHMRNLITSLATQATVIISTHILQEVQAVCDRVIILKDGRKAFDGRLDELQQGGRLLVTLDAVSLDPLDYLRSCGQVKNVMEVPIDDSDVPGKQYALELAATDRYRAAAEIAHGLHEKGHRLYGMHFASRSLETLFAEISG